MKLSVLEPLGVPSERLESMLRRSVGEETQLVLWPDRSENEEELIARSRDADGVVLSNIPFGRRVLEQCPRLKLICVAFTGVDHIDLDCCRERGITVCNCAGYSTAAVAELVFGLVIGLYRRLPACDRAVRTGQTKDGLVGFELEGKRFGVVGTGAIGSRVAAVAAAFGCQVYAYSRTRKQLPGVTYVELDELLATCDVVSLHVPSNQQTRGLISGPQLALMKPTALLINTARGPVVDSEALARALEENRLAGAGIDVFEMEPPIPADHPPNGNIARCAPSSANEQHANRSSQRSRSRRHGTFLSLLK